MSRKLFNFGGFSSLMHKSFALLVLVVLILGFSSAMDAKKAKELVKKGGRLVLRKIKNQENIVSTESFEIKKDSNGYFFAKVLPENVEHIVSNGFEIIAVDMPVKAFLQDSVGIINATKVWNLSSGGNLLNGSGVSVCVIDTGVDKSHNDLSGKILAEHCFCSNIEGSNSYCCPGGQAENSNATDNNGHGTHVAGIIAASGGISGIAKGANIVAVKVLNSTGAGYESDVKKAIEWCANDTQISNYNITVISLSLGGSQFNSEEACLLNDSIGVSSAINTAVTKNISVVVATGNGAGPEIVNGISSPACLPNTTRVTAVNKDKTFASYAFRNSNFSDILAAPGTMINSTYLGGSYAEKNGTSMATPMVSGAIALISQYLRISSQKKTPLFIRNLLKQKGKSLYDSLSQANYSLIDSYNAILSLDVDPPTISLLNPSNNSISPSTNKTFLCNASDWQLANITLYIWNSSGIFYNSSKNISGTQNSSSFNVSNLSYGSYSWNCMASDTLSNSAFYSSNFSFIVGGVGTILLSPQNNTFTNSQSINFSCRGISEENSSLSNITLYIWNESSKVYTKSKNVSGTLNTTNFSYTLQTEGNFYWNCLVFNNASNSSWAEENYTGVYDNRTPKITSVSSSVSDSSATISWNTNELANSSVSGALSNSSSEFELNHSLFFSGLSPETTYTYNITSCDRAGNCNNSGTYSLKTAAKKTSGGSSHSSSNGQGGSSEPKKKEKKTIYLGEKIHRGIEIAIQIGDKVTFKLGEENHSLSIENISGNSASFIINSTKKIISLKKGESVRLNLTSKDFFDLFLKLNSVSNNSVNVTLKEINESIHGKIVHSTSKKTAPPNESGKIVFNLAKKITLLIILSGLLTLLIESLVHWKNLRKKKRLRSHGKKKSRYKKSKKIKTKTKHKG
ncbi:hypothetical protein D6829_00080 [Candidatus Pacearchaeota archaeon]|nr:MAG: hypothetical protein D6829_00080 [Candidatus Pacearchaeota archaeon]